MRIAIVGGPRTGKSTLARELAADAGCPILCTDPAHLVKDPEPGVEYVPSKHVAGHAGVTPDVWSLASQYVADHFLTRTGPWVLDGVGVSRALRKWLRHEAMVSRAFGANAQIDVRALIHWAVHSGSAPPPVDQLIWLRNAAHVPLKPGQAAMTKGVDTVMRELLPWLEPVLELRHVARRDAWP